MKKEEDENIVENPNKLTEEEIERYSRQIVLDEMNNESQLKLKNSKVLIIGAGGLGSSCIAYLAGAGIGTIGIVEFDKVELSNLPRQIIHSSKNIGLNKAESAKLYIKSLNPNIQVDVYSTKIDNKNGIDLIKNYELVIDCCDNPLTRYIVNDICVILNKTFISGASIRWDGQLSTYIKDSNGQKLPCYRCLFPQAPLKENVKKCSEVGVMGTIPGIIGALEANEAIKYLLNANDHLLCKKMIYFDGYDDKFKLIKCRDCRDECVVCGKNPQITLKNIENYNYNKFINNN